MTDRELMQQALDALQEYVAVVVSVNDPNDWTPKVADAGEPARKAIEALRARLAQPEPKPVAWQDTAKPSELVAAEDWENIDPQWHWMYRPLYLAPPQRKWVGLTDEDMNKLRHLVDWTAPLDIKKFASAIEAKLKEKNSG